MDISQIFVAFSEYMNFISLDLACSTECNKVYLITANFTVMAKTKWHALTQNRLRGLVLRMGRGSFSLLPISSHEFSSYVLLSLGKQSDNEVLKE